MKKLIIIIFAFFSLAGNGQYQTTNLDFLFNGSIAVNGSDTLLVDSITGTFDTDYKLYKYTGSLDKDYISLDEYGFLIIYSDTLPLSYFKQIGAKNYNDADTMLSQYSGKTYDSEGFVLLPNRLTRLSHYSTATTDINDYWEALNITASMLLVPAEYGTIQAAINASTNDTVVVNSGYYPENWSATTALYSNNKTVTIICNGDVVIQKASQTYAILFNNGFVKCYGMQVDGNSTGINVNLSATDHIFDAGLIYNVGTNPLRIDNASVSNTIIDAPTTTSNIFINGDGVKLEHNYFNAGNQTSIIRPNTEITAGIKLNYNKIKAFSPTTFYNTYNNGNDTITYNEFTATLVTNFISQVDTGLTGSKYIKGNYFHPDSVRQAIGGGFVYYRDSYQMQVYAENNRIKIDSGICSGYTFYGLDTTSVKNDTIDIKYNLYAINILGPKAGGYQGNNYIVCRFSTSTDLGFLIRVSADTHRANTYFLTEGNAIFAPNYFNETRTGIHACIFSEAKHHDVKFNYINGSNDIGNIVLKAKQITTYNTTIQGNVIVNGAILLKGYPFVKIYNNTFTDSKNSAIRIIDDEDVVGEESYSTDSDIRNNIFFSEVFDDGLINVTGDSALKRLIFDYNVLYGDTIIKRGVGDYLTFSEWQGLGYDANSYNANISGAGLGINLGATYNYGLDPSATFPGPTLRLQRALWSIGAYVLDLNRILKSGSKMLISNGKILIYK